MKVDAKNEFRIRDASLADLDNLRKLFRKSVLSISANFYTDEQRNAWASAADDKEKWKKKFECQQFFIAESAETILGFGSIDNGGYLDFLYVHPDFQRLGVATAILRFIEAHAISRSIMEIQVHASSVAYSFFLQHGFVQLNKRTVEVNNVSMINFTMQKTLEKENQPTNG